MPEQPVTFSKIAEELIGDLRGIPPAEPARMQRRPTRELKDLLEELLIKHHVGRQTLEDRIRENWPNIVGPANAAYTHVGQIDPRGRLLILVSHAIVRSELGLHRPAILEKIRRLPGCSHIRDLQLRAS